MLGSRRDGFTRYERWVLPSPEVSRAVMVDGRALLTFWQLAHHVSRLVVMRPVDHRLSPPYRSEEEAPRRGSCLFCQLRWTTAMGLWFSLIGSIVLWCLGCGSWVGGCVD